MRIAITGATGFLGRPLVRELCEAGHAVRVLTRNPSGAGSFGPGEDARLEVHPFDGTKPVPPSALEGVDAVVDLAGENVSAHRWNEDVKRRIRDSRVVGTAHLAEAMRASGTARALFLASGVGYYGDRGAEPLTETSAPGADFLAQVCVEREAAAKPAEDAGARVVALRIGIVLHPSGGALQRMLLPFRLGVGGPLGSGAQYFPWIHREDAVGMIAWALTNANVAGPLNVVAPEPVTNRAFSKALGRALRRPALLPAPAFALRMVLGELAQDVLGGQRAVPERALSLGYTFRHPTLEGALSHLL